MNNILKAEYHEKWWGNEKWIANSKDYCGKLLFFKKDTAEIKNGR